MNPTDITNLDEREKEQFQSQLDKGFSPQTALGVISSDTLSGNTGAYTVPSVSPTTGAEGLSGFATSYAEQFKKQQAELAKATQEAQNARNTEKKGLLDTMSGILGIQSSQVQLEEEAGLGGKQQKVTDVTNQIEASNRAQVNEIRALESANMTDAGRASAVREINRKYAFEQADLALIQSAANRDLETASNIINRKIELQLEPLKTKLEFQKLFYDENKDLFDKAETRQFESLIKDSDRQYEDTKALEKYKADITLSAVQNGVTIPGYVLSELNRATSQSEVAQVLAKNRISLQNPLDVEHQRLVNEKLRQDIQDTIDAGKPIITSTDPTKTSIENNQITLDSIFGSSKVSAGNKTTIGNALALASAAKDLAEANTGGKFSGLYPGRGIVDFFTPKFLKREKTVSNEALISALDLQTQFWASGAALSDTQTELVQKMIPTKTDTDKAIRAKTNQLVNYMLSQTATRLQTDGISYKPAKVDLFETTKLLEQASPEQLEQLRAEGLIQ